MPAFTQVMRHIGRDIKALNYFTGNAIVREIGRYSCQHQQHLHV